MMTIGKAEALHGGGSGGWRSRKTRSVGRAPWPCACGYTRPTHLCHAEDHDGLERRDAVVGGRRRAGGGRAGHRHLLPADAGAGLRGRRAGRACRAGLPARRSSRPRWSAPAPRRSGTSSAARSPRSAPARVEPRRQPRHRRAVQRAGLGQPTARRASATAAAPGPCSFAARARRRPANMSSSPCKATG